MPSPAAAASANVAALQSALTALNLYKGFVDGVRGPLTRSAVIRFQRRRGLLVDGIAGPQTLRALGRRGRPPLGRRVMHMGHFGWDVAALQFLLLRRGYGPGRVDGAFGPLTRAAVVRAQRARGVGVDGLAGPQTISSLRGRRSGAAAPKRFLRPVPGGVGDGFGAPRPGGRRHQGVDFPVPHGTRVGAAAPGTTIFAAHNYGGYGNLVVIQHAAGYTTWYAHLARITSWVGEQVGGGTRIGYVGSTGYSTGPHLHFEVRRYNTPVNPVPLLSSAVAAQASGRRSKRGLECRGDDRSVKAPGGATWIARERLCRG
ncbi:MAG TPA: peptidoglycan-binding protein [Thermoleophilaceae bacterium]|nr:peptidoglycan-binding protein [Thermoleophilaceae bacterium]